jgi:osmoprotectant transport system permease protein
MILVKAIHYIQSNPESFIRAVMLHMQMSVGAVLIASAFGVPVGFFARHASVLNTVLTSSFNMLRVIPGIAVLALLMPIVGTGVWPATLALVLLVFPTIVLNTISGFRQADAETLEAAYGLGMKPLQVFLKVQFPIALPVILNGVRIGLVEAISAAALAAFIGGGGLGQFIVNGLGMANLTLLLVGALPIAVLALLSETLFGVAIRRMTWMLKAA